MPQIFVILNFDSLSIIMKEKLNYNNLLISSLILFGAVLLVQLVIKADGTFGKALYFDDNWAVITSALGDYFWKPHRPVGLFIFNYIGIFGSIVFYKVFFHVIYSICSITTFHIFRRISGSDRFSFIAALLAFVNPYSIEYGQFAIGSHYMLGYLFGSLGFLAAARLYDREKFNVLWFVVALLLFIASPYSSNSSYIFPFAIFVLVLLDKKIIWKRALRLISLIAGIGLAHIINFQFFGLQFHHYASKGTRFSANLETIFENIVFTIKTIPDFISQYIGLGFDLTAVSIFVFTSLVLFFFSKKIKNKDVTFGFWYIFLALLFGGILYLGPVLPISNPGEIRLKYVFLPSVFFIPAVFWIIYKLIPKAAIPFAILFLFYSILSLRGLQYPYIESAKVQEELFNNAIPSIDFKDNEKNIVIITETIPEFHFYGQYRNFSYDNGMLLNDYSHRYSHFNAEILKYHYNTDFDIVWFFDKEGFNIRTFRLIKHIESENIRGRFKNNPFTLNSVYFYKHNKQTDKYELIKNEMISKGKETIYLIIHNNKASYKIIKE